MIKVIRGQTEIEGDVNTLINEMGIALMVVTENISKEIGLSVEEVMEHIMTSLSIQRMAKAGMSIEDVEDVLNTNICREKSDIL